MKDEPGWSELKAGARRKWLLKQVPGFAKEANADSAFNMSQKCAGYQKAFDSWESAVWKWFDSFMPPRSEEIWREKLFAEPKNSGFKEGVILEDGLQAYLARRAIFLEGLKK